MKIRWPLSVFAMSAGLAAQCDQSWAMVAPPAGIEGVGHTATAWDPDGVGPRPESLVVAGDFLFAGNVAAKHIAAFDPTTSTWSPLGSGIAGSVHDVAALANGRLVAAGDFSDAGGVPTSLIAQWDGVAWSPLGGGIIGNAVHALTKMQNGDLVAVGDFFMAGNVVAYGVARWNGTAWSALGAGLAGTVNTRCVTMPNGDIVVLANGTGFQDIMRWDGTSWSSAFGSIPNPLGPSQVLGNLAADTNGELVVAGQFTSIGGVAAANIARWDGSSFRALGLGISSGSANNSALQFLPNGDLLVGGRFSAAGMSLAHNVARWNGSSWFPLGAGVISTSQIPFVNDFAVMANGSVAAVGSFQSAGSVRALSVATWNGAQWSATNQGAGIHAVRKIVVLPNGHIVAIGTFDMAGSAQIRRVARFDGANWHPMTTGGQFVWTDDIACAPNGDVIVSGRFTPTGGVEANHITRWDGTQWHLLSGGINSASKIAVKPDGTVVVGTSGVGLHARTGSTWTQLAGTGGLSQVSALSALPDGRLLVGTLDGVVALHDGNLIQLGNRLPQPNVPKPIRSVAMRPNGEILATIHVSFDGSGEVQRWNGAQWSSLGFFETNRYSYVDPMSMLVLPDGDVMINARRDASLDIGDWIRWDGMHWAVPEEAYELSGPYTRYGANLFSMALAANGDIWFAGDIQSANGMPSFGLARLTTNCAATAQTLGVGCDGDTLTTTSPWLGSTWRAEARGLPGNGIALAVLGFQNASLPLANVFPTALAGCTLHVSPDAVLLLLCENGAATLKWAVPDAPEIIGMAFGHQVVSIADATLTMTATNAVTLTVGVL